MLKAFKEEIGTLQAVVTIIGILVGGWWTYNLFIKERQHYPHANIDQIATHVELSKDINLIRTATEVSNTGNSRLIIKKSMIRIQQILPVIPCENINPCAVNQINHSLQTVDKEEDRFSWPLVSERVKHYGKGLDIEPGEKDVIDFEFAIPSSVKVIRIYTYFRNEDKSVGSSEVGWSDSIYYDFRKGIQRTTK